MGKNPNPNRTAATSLNSGTTVTSVTSSSIAGQPLVSTDNSNLSKLGGSGHSPSLDDRNANGVGYRLHRSHVPVTSSKSASPPSTKTKLSRGGGSAGHHYGGLTSGVGGSVGVPGGGSHETSMNQPESDKDYSYVKFPRRSELPHDYSYPLLPEGLRRTTAAAADPPSWPPYKTGNALAETPIKKGDSSSSSSSSKKSSRRSLPSLVLSCAGGSPVEEEPDEPELPHGLLNAVEMGAPPQVGGGHQGMHGPAGAGLVTTSGTASSTSGTSASNTYNTLTCLHCRKSFKPGANRKGECPMAPNDKARSFVEHVSCLQCANCFVYHCMSDSEGDYGGHPCDCANVQGSIWKRWLGLSFLAILVPCLCCYPPLMACYRCGAACNMCGGKHYSPNKNEPSY